MNHQLWNRVGARVLAAMFVVAGAAACGDDDTRVSANTSATTASSTSATTASNGSGTNLDERAERSGLPSDASPSAVVIGTAPAQPTAETAAVTPPPGGRSELSKQEQSAGQPNEGDNHSYSTVAPNTPQKAGNVDPVANDSDTKEATK